MSDESSPSIYVAFSWIGIAAAGVFCVESTRRLHRAGPHFVLWKHAAFFAGAAFAAALVADEVRSVVFSPIGICIVGTIFPVYQSIVAIATPGTGDDTSWLQYWIAMGIVRYTTEWVDDIGTRSEMVKEYWYEFEMIYFLWLLLPFTDGAAVTFKYITEPIIAPIVTPLAKKCDGWINRAVLIVINASHLWILWAAFVILDADLKKFIAISVGTVFPIMSSIVAVCTPAGEDDTYWLTYWASYSLLFLLMDFLENFLGKIPGFYSIFLFTTVYLMLPLFRGAEEVYRKILVPLTGQQEMLLLRDAENVKKQLMKDVPVEHQARIRKSIAESFLNEANEDEAEQNNSERKPLPVDLEQSGRYQSLVEKGNLA